MLVSKFAAGLAFFSLIVGKGELAAQSNRGPFTEGFIYSKVSFPVHPIQPIMRRIDFNKDDIVDQYKRLKDSFSLDPAGLADPMFMSVIFLSPVSMKSTFEKNNSLVETQSLSYQLVNRVVNDSGKFMIRPFNTNSEKVEVVYQTASMKKIWEKYEINEKEFTVQQIPGTDMVAGYECKKMSFNFNGTSSQVLSSRLIGNIPWNVTVWYSELFPSSINIQQPFYFNLSHGILKTQIVFDKDGKNKMIYEVTRVVAKDVSDDDFKIAPFVLPLKYPAQTEKITTSLMTIMATALQDM